jgi:2'-hydroxyisoflavone reductase
VVRLLVLGGTLFLGRAVVKAALGRGDEISIFTRGQTNADLFGEEVEQLRGDRDGDLSALERRSWDAVVDTSGYVPRVVGASARLLAPRVSHYVFVSSISVYRDFSRGPDESSAVETPEDPASEDVQAHYGGLKALSERQVEEAFPGRAAIVRAGLIVGPWDPTDRFTYWVTRVASGGEVLAPGKPERRIQFIDARDLAEWMLRLADDRVSGTFNATGPEPRPTMGELLETAWKVSGSDARIVWVDDSFLLENSVGQWIELPLWVAEPEWQGLLQADVSRALAAGLTFRPLEETVRATLEWARSPDGRRPPKTGIQVPKPGLEPEREAELLAAWGARREE